MMNLSLYMDHKMPPQQTIPKLLHKESRITRLN